MRTDSKATITPIVTMLLFVSSVFAGGHTILNGTWKLEPAKSDFSGQPVVQTGTVTIEEKRGVTIISRNFKYEGAKETFFYSDSAGSENNSTIHASKDLKSKIHWDGEVLQVTTTQSGVVTVETYTLAPDGTMRVNVARPGHTPITLVFDRQ